MPPTNSLKTPFSKTFRESNPASYFLHNYHIWNRDDMALIVRWYDFICFGIVGGAFVGSLWVLWRKEASSRCDDNTVYESLLMARPDNDGFVRSTPLAHVGSSQLWTSCWRGVHPGWLLLTRFVSCVAMAGFLTWDILDWDASIFLYYTE